MTSQITPQRGVQFEFWKTYSIFTPQASELVAAGVAHSRVQKLYPLNLSDLTRQLDDHLSTPASASAFFNAGDLIGLTRDLLDNSHVDELFLLVDKVDFEDEHFDGILTRVESEDSEAAKNKLGERVLELADALWLGYHFDAYAAPHSLLPGTLAQSLRRCRVALELAAQLR